MRRRQFLSVMSGAAVAGCLTAHSYGRVLGANERVRIGWIGCGGRGFYVARRLREVPDVEIVAVSDVYEQNLAAAKSWVGPHCVTAADFRHLLDQSDIDAVLIATPDHWHAIPAVLACQAGKDVYVEKPLGHNVREGRAVLNAARRDNRIVQVGTQQRSAPHFAAMRQIVQSGQLGRVHFVRIWNYRNAFPAGVGRQADSTPPAGLDWDFYLGPAPLVPYNRNRFLGSFRWFWDYAGGILTDWGTHRLDSMHQVLGVDQPLTVAAAGGRYALDDGCETPDTLQVTYEYPGFIVSYEASALNAHGTGGRTPGRAYYRANGVDDRPNGLAFYGTNGTLMADRLGFEVLPELKPGVSLRQPSPAKPVDDLLRTSHQGGESPDSTLAHVKNFIDCVRDRQRPAADVEHGHRASLVAHLGNIAYRTGRKLRWDAASERIADDAEAEQLLGRTARAPWNLL